MSEGGFPHRFPRLELGEPPAWVAWNVGGAADRLGQLSFQVTLVRPLRGDAHAPAMVESIHGEVAAGRATELRDFDRRRAVDELADAPEGHQGVLAQALWASAMKDGELRSHMLRRVARHVIYGDPAPAALVAGFPAFSVEAPIDVTEVCLMLDALIDAARDPVTRNALGNAVMRDYVVRELGLQA